MNGGLGLGLRLGMGGGGGGVPVTNIFNDSNIVRTFSEEVQPLTVTNVGDGSGSFEVFNDTAAAWVAGALSTSDNIQWTFNPTSNFTVGDSITLHLKATILTVVGDNPYEGPFTVEYKVVNRLPTMDTFTVDATSVDANIGILTATGTDLDGHTLTFGISLTDDSSTVALYQNEAAWQGSGFDTGLPEGTDATETLYCFAKDTSGGISLVSISDTCAVDIPDTTAPVMTAFTVEPTSVVANIEIFTLLATDAVGVASYQVNEVATIPDAGVGTWKSSAQWITDGYDSSVIEGSPETVTLYAWAKDAADNVSAAPTLSDSCDVTITHAPTFAVQPTVSTGGELYDGAKLDFTITDVSSDNVDVDYSINGVDWTVLLTDVVAASYAQTDVAVEGLAAGTITTLQLRVYDSGDTNYTESNAVASFDTVAPVLTSVTPGDTTNTLVFADNANDTADSFNIHWGTTTGVLTNTIASVTSPYVHTGRTNDTEYFYEIVAIKGGLESTASAEDSGTPTDVWTPDNLWLGSEEGGWRDFTDTAGMFVNQNETGAVSNDSKVRFATDQGPNSKDFQQADSALAGRAPTWKSADNGYLQFDGGDNSLGCPRLFTGDVYTVAILLNTPAAQGGNRTIFAQHSGNANPGRLSLVIIDASSDDLASFANDGSAGYLSVSTTSVVGETGYYQFITEMTGSGSLGVRVDNGSIEDEKTGIDSFTAENTVCSLGGIQDSGSQVLGNAVLNNTLVNVKASVAIGRILTTGERTSLKTWMDGLE